MPFGTGIERRRGVNRERAEHPDRSGFQTNDFSVGENPSGQRSNIV
jgi:hypothetical protein